ncbi:MAG: hypothetical protein AAFZ07_22800 [Actinomycetota bacterium]
MSPLLGLQQQAGNAATTLYVERTKASLTDMGHIRRRPWMNGLGLPRLPESGPSVRAELRGRLPGLLSALNEAQLDRWQEYVDYTARRAVFDRYVDALYRTHGIEVRRGSAARTLVATDAKAELERLERGRPSTRLAGSLEIKASDLLAPAIQRPPDRDVVAEMGFRQWAAEQLATKTITLDIAPQLPAALAARVIRLDLGSMTLPFLHHRKGVITVEDLQAEFADEYRENVTHRPELAELRGELKELKDAQGSGRAAHATMSESNAEQPLVRHIGELLGRGGYDYPSIRGWDAPMKATLRAEQLVAERRLVIAIPIIGRAVEQTNDIAERFGNYYGEVMSGVGRAVTVLEGAKWLGAIAASVASGGLGLAASSLITGGYAATQNLVQQASAVNVGLQDRVDAQSAVDDAGIAIVMSLVGGKVQGRFEQVIHLRLNSIQGLGDGAKQFLANMVASTAASPITTSTNAVLDAIINGTALPSSPEEFADMIVKGAVQDTIVNLGTYGVSARVAAEFTAWRAGRAAPIEIPGADPVRPSAEGPAATLHDTSIRSMLERRGGWQEVHSDLTQGEGLGAGLSATDRRAVLQRFEAHRRALATEVADDFGGRVERSGDGELRVVFDGEDAAVRRAQAAELLQLKDPAWRASGVSLEARPATSGVAEQDIAAMMDADVRHLANQFSEVYQMWGQMGPEGRARWLAAAASGALEKAGYPPIGIKLGGANDLPSRAGGVMDSQTWRMVIRRDYFEMSAPTPQQFAQVASLVAHEARHALQWVRAARASGDETAMNELRPDVREHVRTNENMETLLPGTPAHDAALRFHESVFGDAKPVRDQIYRDLELAAVGVQVFTDNLATVTNDAASSPSDVQKAQLALAEAHEQLRTADEAYRNLPEERDAYAYQAATDRAVNRALARQQDRLIASHRTASEQLERRIERFEQRAVWARTATGDERAIGRLKRAQDDMLASMRRVKRIEDRLAAFAIKVRR